MGAVTVRNGVRAIAERPVNTSLIKENGMSVQQQQPGFRLIKSEVKTLTKEFAEYFRDLEASPTERELNPVRLAHLRAKADAGQLITFGWATAKIGDKTVRVNGQHSSAMLAELNGSFPTDLK